MRRAAERAEAEFLKLVCNVNIVYGNLKSENSQDAQKPQRNCAPTFMYSASERERTPVCSFLGPLQPYF